jgi:hypothetical protein
VSFLVLRPCSLQASSNLMYISSNSQFKLEPCYRRTWGGLEVRCKPERVEVCAPLRLSRRNRFHAPCWQCPQSRMPNDTTSILDCNFTQLCHFSMLARVAVKSEKEAGRECFSTPLHLPVSGWLHPAPLRDAGAFCKAPLQGLAGADLVWRPFSKRTPQSSPPPHKTPQLENRRTEWSIRPWGQWTHVKRYRNNLRSGRS